MPTECRPDRPGDEWVWICTPYVTRNGRRIFASQYGLKAFCFWARRRQ